MKKNLTKEYSNGEVTVVWNPSACIHSAVCWKNKDSLPEVFNPAAKPWINVSMASSERIIHQVKQCPSGALSYRMNIDKEEKPAQVVLSCETLVNGPLIVEGPLQFKNSDGKVQTLEGKTAFCRCGASSNKPFCDGSHRQAGFIG